MHVLRCTTSNGVKSFIATFPFSTHRNESKTHLWGEEGTLCACIAWIRIVFFRGGAYIIMSHKSLDRNWKKWTYVIDYLWIKKTAVKEEVWSKGGQVPSATSCLYKTRLYLNSVYKTQINMFLIQFSYYFFFLIFLNSKSQSRDFWSQTLIFININRPLYDINIVIYDYYKPISIFCLSVLALKIN